MDRFAAHYIFTGDSVLRKAVLAQDANKKIVSLSAEDAMAIEYSNTIFYNGIICPVFCPFYSNSTSGYFTIVSLNEELPHQKVDPLKLVISFFPGEEKKLFVFFNQLHIKFEYTIFDLLKAVCHNNYLANNKPAPILKVGQKTSLFLLTKLNLIEGTFGDNTHLKLL